MLCVYCWGADDGQTGSNTVSTDGEALSRFATEGLCCLALTLGLRLEPRRAGRQLPPWLAEPPPFGTPVRFAPMRICGILITVSRMTAILAV